jgi:hypothetical protein
MINQRSTESIWRIGWPPGEPSGAAGPDPAADLRTLESRMESLPLGLRRDVADRLDDGSGCLSGGRGHRLRSLSSGAGG